MTILGTTAPQAVIRDAEESALDSIVAVHEQAFEGELSFRHRYGQFAEILGEAAAAGRARQA